MKVGDVKCHNSVIKFRRAIGKVSVVTERTCRVATFLSSNVGGIMADTLSLKGSHLHSILLVNIR
jgi:hypothetical protein